MVTSDQTIYIKVPILGNTNVGKTTLFNFFRGQTEKRFSYKNNDFILFEQVSFKNKIFNIQFWDSYGAKNHKKLPSDIFEGAGLAIVMYDVADLSKKSYNSIISWVERLWKENELKKVPVLLIGNKIDLRDARIQTLSLNECRDVGVKLANEYSLKVPQIEISALTKVNCERILAILLDLYLENNNKRISEFY